MKRKLFAAIMLLSICVNANSTAERPITNEVKDRIVLILQDGLQKSDITQAQYNDALKWLNSTPCKGIDRKLTENDSVKLAKIIAKQQGVPKTEVHQSFKYEGWSILYVSVFNSEDPYLFYSENPERSPHPITEWSGAATMLETTEVKEWVLQNAPGIPKNLASCFAWHVTLNSY